MSKMPDIDSGVASPETAPDDQLIMDKETNDLSSDMNKDNNISKVESESRKVTVFQPKSKSIAEEDDSDDIDETLVERFIGLTEMFPDSLRSASCAVTNGTISLIKGTYSLTRQIVWISVTSSVILFAPVMFEVERFNMEEMTKQDRNRLVLGPGSAMSAPVR